MERLSRSLLMKRVVDPEILDVLPDRDARALDSRRDIHRLNLVMGNLRTLCSLLPDSPDGRTPRRIVELGAGDGIFALRFARQLARRWPGAHMVLVDTKDVITHETRRQFAALGWTVEVVITDVFDWLHATGKEPADLITANLFLHQFPEPQLTEMLRLAADRTRLFAACEPRRSRIALTLSRMVGFIGCNDVTRHDAAVSVRAGFRTGDLSRLWPARSQWRLQEREAWLTHSFVARRVNGP